jgi:outer membrane beta-barrel protein
VLALALPASAQEEGGGEEGGAAPADEPLPGEGGEGGEGLEGLPGEPPGQPAPTDEALKPKSSDVAPTTPVLTAGAKRTESQETWKDIVVIPRKYFLKRRRVELMPFFATTMNDNLIQHFALGGEINYFLTDILSIGVSGMYYFKNVLDQEFYTRYHFHRVPSLNKYRYTATLNFAYVPIYGKFTLFNKSIMHYEVFATAGVGISGTEIIPRDYRYDPFTNDFTLTFPVGLGGRLFLTKWLAIQAAFRSYILLDKFEPTTRTDDVEADKSNASTDIVNNMMFNVGFSFFLPTSFKYSTFR